MAGAMKVATFNGAKVYNLASGKTMPQWLSDAKRRALAKDEDFRRRVELIQDFEMATASQAIKMTPDGEHIIVAGTYPPVVRCYTVSDMAMKFQRGLTCEVVTFETLSEDFGKLVFLQTDRTLNFHAPYGTHYSVRVPKFGRDLVYGWSNCDLYVAGSGEEVYRLNLEQGMFKEPFMLGFTGCNKVHMNPVHNFLGCGGETAACEFWDPRSRKAVAKLQVDANTNVEVTALKFDTDGLSLAIGTSNGNCKLYDIRSHRPLYVKEHQYGLPVIDVTFHNNGTKHILSTDKKVVKIWERHEPNLGRILTNIETPCDINAIQCVSDRRGQSGMLMLAGEQSRMMVYYVPQLGPAPRWCSFLEGLTEELEESSSQSVYEDFKFVTKVEVEEMGAAGLIGTPMLRGYMHGFFMEMKLYNKLRAVSKPFEYEEHRKKKIQAKIEEKRQSRIIAQKRLPKINRDLAGKMMQSSGKSGGAGEDGEEGTGKGGNRFIDSRFAALFEREEFQRDETSEEFKLRNPSHGRNTKRGGGDDSDDELEQMYQPVSVDNDDDDEDDYDVDDDDDDDGGVGGYGDSDGEDSDIDQVRADYAERKRITKKRKSRGEEEEDDDEGEITRATRRAKERMKITAKLAKKVVAQETKSKTGNNNGSSSTKSNSSSSSSHRKEGNKAPRMYELADGISSSKATFSHTVESKQKRASDRAIGAVPLLHRLSASDTSSSQRSQIASRISSSSSSSMHDGGMNGGGDDYGGQEIGKVKYLRTEEEGLVRAFSYIPQASYTGKGEDKLVRGGGKSSTTGGTSQMGGENGKKRTEKGKSKGTKGGKKGKMDEREAFF